MKKNFSLIVLLSLLIVSITKVPYANAQQFKPFEFKNLEYAYDALEPYIDKETMILHHTKHYKNYLDKLNATVEKHPELYSLSLFDLLTNLDSLPEDVAISIKNNGGGVYNHEFFFAIMTPNKTSVSNELADAINRDFGSFDNFKTEFKNKASNVFGSGWTWLVSDQSGKLCIVSTSNQDSPITKNLKPIIGIDIWEHAYYLHYQNNRATYIDNWFNVINWNQALKNYNM